MADVSTRKFTHSLTGLKNPAGRLAIRRTRKAWSGDFTRQMVLCYMIPVSHKPVSYLDASNNIETKPLLENKVIENYTRMFGNECH